MHASTIDLVQRLQDGVFSLRVHGEALDDNCRLLADTVLWKYPIGGFQGHHPMRMNDWSVSHQNFMLENLLIPLTSPNLDAKGYLEL